MHGSQVGVVAGSSTGVLVGLLIYKFPELIGAKISIGIVFIMAFFGALFGAWVASMVGSSTPNSRLRSFEKTMEEGHILLILV